MLFSQTKTTGSLWMEAKLIPSWNVPRFEAASPKKQTTTSPVLRYLQENAAPKAFLSAVDEQGGTLILVTHNAGWARRGGLTELPFVMEEDEQGLTAVLDDRWDEALSPPDPVPARGSSC